MNPYGYAKNDIAVAATSKHRVTAEAEFSFILRSSTNNRMLFEVLRRHATPQPMTRELQCHLGPANFANSPSSPRLAGGVPSG